MQVPAPAPAAKSLSLIDLMLGSSGVVLVVLVLLIAASFSVWVIWFLKSFQLGRLRRGQALFEHEAAFAGSANQLLSLAAQHPNAPGARIVLELGRRQRHPHLTVELLLSVAKRAIVTEQQRASSLMPTLSSIASASPFIGLFGTVWGIMDAFFKIGLEKSASLPVVAPAIGEALIATAFGLVAAIPATIGFNYVDQRIANLMGELETSSETWVQTLAHSPMTSVHHAGRAATFPAGE